MIKKFLFVAIAASSTIQAQAKGPSWDYIEAGYSYNEYDDFNGGLKDAEFDTYHIAASSSLSSKFFVRAEIDFIDDEVETDTIKLDIKAYNGSFGLGYNHRINKRADAYAVVSFENQSLEIPLNDYDEEDNGFGVAVGLVNKIKPWYEVQLEVKHVDVVEESNTSLKVENRINFAKGISMGLAYTHKEDASAVTATFRYNF